MPRRTSPAGQLTALDTYESTFGVRQVDGYVYPTSALGQTDVSGGALDGTTATLTAAGLAAFPELKGPVTFSTGTYGYPATVNSGAPYTPLLTTPPGTSWQGCTSTRAPTPRPGCRSWRSTSTTTPARTSGCCWRRG